MMKILIGHDGSNSADAALVDLRRAGLPDDAEALVVSVADTMMVVPTSAYELSAQALMSRVVRNREDAERHLLRAIASASRFAVASRSACADIGGLYAAMPVTASPMMRL